MFMFLKRFKINFETNIKSAGRTWAEWNESQGPCICQRAGCILDNSSLVIASIMNQ